VGQNGEAFLISAFFIGEPAPLVMGVLPRPKPDGCGGGAGKTGDWIPGKG
jgi:hypothetical protein